MSVSCFNKNRIGKVFLVSIIVIMMLMAIGCSDTQKNIANNSYEEYVNISVASNVVSANSKFQLLWDDSTKNIFIYEIATQRVWGTTPYDYYLQEDPSGLALTRLYSPLIVHYFDKDALQFKTVYAYPECISEGTVTAETIENGIKVTYYFEHQQFSIPVSYQLTNEGLRASL